MVLANPWTDNVVAIGSSAGFIDPLDSTSLFNLQAGIVNLVKCIDKKPSVYNRLMRKIHYDSQQFIECLYGLTIRTDTSFWSYMANRDKYTEQFWRNHDTRKNANLNVFPRDIYKQLIPYFHLG